MRIAGAPLRGRFYHGWVIVGVLALTVTVSYGVLMYAFPVVLAAMQAELGWSQQALMGGYSIGALAGGATAIPVGRWIDRHGSRAAMTWSAAVASLLVWAWSQVQSPIAFYLIWIGLGASSAGLFYEPAFATIAQWFDRRRVRALTIVTVAGGLASTIFVPLTAELTERFGWRNAILGLSVLLAALTVLPHALVLRPRPTSPERQARARSTREVLQSASLRWLISAFALSTFANIAFAVHLIPLLLERGHALAMASLALASIGVMKLVGRVLIVPLARRVAVTSATVMILLLQSAGLLVLVTSSSTPAVWVCVILFGIGDGGSTPARAELVAEFYGRASYGTISGVIALFLAGARAMGPVGVSFVYAATGGYGAPLLLMMSILILASWTLRSAGKTHGRYAVVS